MAIKISGTTIINDSRAILDHTSSVGTAGSILASTGSGICWKDAPSAGFSADAQENLYAGTGAGASSDADTCWNIGIGYSALYSQDASGSYDGEKNVAIGCLAMCKATGGKEHVAIGRKAGAGLVAGYNNIYLGSYAGGNVSCTINSEFNIGIGYGALRGNTGSCNIAIGYESQNLGNSSHNFSVGRLAGNNVQSANNVLIGECAVRYTLTGNGNNIAIGKRAMFCAGGANYNTVLGNHAGKRITTGHCNIFMGNYAGSGSGGDVTGDNNVAIGSSAGASNTSGDKSVFIGYCAGANVKQGGCNIAIGNMSGVGTDGQTTGGVENITMGLFAGRCLGDDSYFNIIIGKSGHTMTNGHRNILIGHFAGAYGYPNGNRNIVMGEYAGRNLGAGSCNILLGASAGCNFGTGEENIAIGRLAMGNSIVTGNCNIAIGVMAGKALLSGSCNVFLGECACKCVDTYARNTFLGSRAGHYTCGSDNTSVGWNAGSNIVGDYNVFIGRNAGKGESNSNTHRNIGIGLNALDDLANGCCNTVVGQEAGYCVSSGHNNVFFGSCAGYYVTTGDYNVLIGAGTSAPSATGNCQLAIGNSTSNWITGDSSFDIVTNSIVPSANNTKNLGATGTRWANIYTNDLQLSNKGSVNDIDGTWGDFTVQEGENDLFLINNRSGKKYKFNLTEVA